MTDTLQYRRLQDQLRRTRQELLAADTTKDRRTELRARRERLLDQRDQLEGL